MTSSHNQWWHELNTWEPEAALAFYSRTLGWEFEPATTSEGAGYWVARSDGQAVGGIYELTEPSYEGVPSHWMTYLAVQNIEQAGSDTVKAGGSVMREPVRIPGVGRLAVVSDAGGAVIGLIEHDDARQQRAGLRDAVAA
jgi:uncharacterized protein